MQRGEQTAGPSTDSGQALRSAQDDTSEHYREVMVLSMADWASGAMIL